MMIAQHDRQPAQLSQGPAREDDEGKQHPSSRKQTATRLVLLLPFLRRHGFLSASALLALTAAALIRSPFRWLFELDRICNIEKFDPLYRCSGHDAAHDSLASASAYAAEIIAAKRTLQSFNGEDAAHQKYAGDVEFSYREAIAAARARACLTGVAISRVTRRKGGDSRFGLPKRGATG
ncbi:hypothetical protein QA646_29810 (plasmid) [Rhizobium sp. CB3090]|nr:hypothetical protein [Rhizobium sp. CB3090]WFU13399.1 hypothetical protein QA646_29810 [Rhizobium sp. CB3090]